MKVKSLDDVRVGDTVIRDLGGVAMPLQVTAITAREIHCGDWIFSRRTGGEIDPDLGWDATHTGSHICPLVGRRAG